MMHIVLSSANAVEGRRLHLPLPANLSPPPGVNAPLIFLRVQMSHLPNHPFPCNPAVPGRGRALCGSLAD